jgi:ClpP class serine protease
MIDAPRPALSIPNLALPPSGRMLVDSEYLLEELMRETQALEAAHAGGSTPTPPVSGSPLVAAGGFGQGRREMGFAHVRLTGIMRSSSAAYVVDALNEAYADPTVSGILFDVNTGGGEVTAASMIDSTITDRNKPVVGLLHLACSGGMLASKNCDELVAAGRYARVGSIGVMMTLPKWMRNVYGEYFTDVYADTSEDKNNAFREWIKTGETDAFKAELNALDKIFMEEMTAARPLNKKTAADTLAGGVWLAEEAKARGLVDSIGTLNYALNRLASYAANNPQ